MKRAFTGCAIALLFFGSTIAASEITGHYVEARTADVWTGPCFANAEIDLEGKNAVIGWIIDKGNSNDVQLDGLGIIAVVESTETLGLKQTGPSKAVLIVDERANKAQSKALIRLAKKQAGKLLNNVTHVHHAKVSWVNCECKGNVCTKLETANARIETRCLHEKSDAICGNESAYYPPLTKGVTAKAAMVVENKFSGSGLDRTWQDRTRRGAYVGTFRVR